MDNVEEMIEAKRAEEAKPKTEAEKIELTRKKALNKIRFLWKSSKKCSKRRSRSCRLLWNNGGRKS